MAAPAGRILQELERDLGKAIHAFGYAPGMDSPWVAMGRWGDAYGALKLARRQVHVLLAAAVKVEGQLANGEMSDDGHPAMGFEELVRRYRQMPDCDQHSLRVAAYDALTLADAEYQDPA
jgi:hypothetical protein